MEIVATIHSRKCPIETRLVFVVTRTVLREYTFAVRRDDGVNVRTKIRLRILHQKGGIITFPIH